MQKIMSSNKYDEFKFFPSNRTISKKFVSILARDETFPDTFPFHPIVVNEALEIVDGQHRFATAKQLGIPVYYVIQEGANEDDIERINVQVCRWNSDQYLQFYAKRHFPAYEILEKISRFYLSFPTYLISAMAYSIEGKGRTQWQRAFKKGEIKIENVSALEEVCDLVIPVMLDIRCKSSLGGCRSLYTYQYMTAIAECFMHDRPKFDKILKKLPWIYTHLPFPKNHEDALSLLQTAISLRGPRS